MCIDVFAPGRCVDIGLLLEQIWIDPLEDTDKRAQLTEVYDLHIRNPKGQGVLDALYMLFPHDCTVLQGGNRRIAITVEPMKHDEWPRRHDWIYTKEPEWVDDESGESCTIRTHYSADAVPKHGRRQDPEGKMLDGTFGFPEQLDDHGQTDLLASMERTCVVLRFNDALKEGDSGWLRLIVRPQHIQFPDPRARIFKGAAVLYDQRLAITCPLLVRDELEVRLLVPVRSPESAPVGTPDERAALHESVFANGLHVKGTSTRIQDHRVAVIASGDIDLLEGNVMPHVISYGEVPLSHLQGHHLGLWWAGGCNQNKDHDLVHNARRVLNRLGYVNKALMLKDIVRDLAPSGKHEAFSALVANMLQVKLLKWYDSGQDNAATPDELKLICLCDKPLSDRTEKRLLELRRLYANPDGDDAHLMREFSDLHPFRISFRAWWPTR